MVSAIINRQSSSSSTSPPSASAADATAGRGAELLDEETETGLLEAFALLLVGIFSGVSTPVVSAQDLSVGKFVDPPLSVSLFVTLFLLSEFWAPTAVLLDSSAFHFFTNSTPVFGNCSFELSSSVMNVVHTNQ